MLTRGPVQSPVAEALAGAAAVAAEEQRIFKCAELPQFKSPSKTSKPLSSKHGHQVKGFIRCSVADVSETVAEAPMPAMAQW